MGAPLMVTLTDREKGIHILEAFRHYSLVPGQPLTVEMLTTYFEQNGLNLDDVEPGLKYTLLEGWAENGVNQSALLTEEGHVYLLD